MTSGGPGDEPAGAASESRAPGDAGAAEALAEKLAAETARAEDNYDEAALRAGRFRKLQETRRAHAGRPARGRQARDCWRSSCPCSTISSARSATNRSRTACAAASRRRSTRIRGVARGRGREAAVARRHPFDPRLAEAIGTRATRRRRRRRHRRGGAARLRDRRRRPAPGARDRREENGRIAARVNYKDYYAGPRRPEGRAGERHQVGVPQARAQVAPRREPRQSQGRRGEVQGNLGGLRGPRRSRQARQVRRARQRLAASRATGRAAAPLPRRAVSVAAGAVRLRRLRRRRRAERFLGLLRHVLLGRRQAPDGAESVRAARQRPRDDDST